MIQLIFEIAALFFVGFGLAGLTVAMACLFYQVFKLIHESIQNKTVDTVDLMVCGLLAFLVSIVLIFLLGALEEWFL